MGEPGRGKTRHSPTGIGQRRGASQYCPGIPYGVSAADTGLCRGTTPVEPKRSRADIEYSLKVPEVDLLRGTSGHRSGRREGDSRRPSMGTLRGKTWDKVQTQTQTQTQTQIQTLIALTVTDFAGPVSAGRPPDPRLSTASPRTRSLHG